MGSANYDPNWKTYPPLRSSDDVEAVIQAIYDGTVDAIATDHSPHHSDEKELDFADAPFGIVGLETAVGLAIDRLVHGRVIGTAQLVRLFSTGPAEVFNLPGGQPARGRTGPTSPCSISGNGGPWTRRGSRPRLANTPFAGRKIRGAPVITIVAGNIVWQASK